MNTRSLALGMVIFCSVGSAARSDNWPEFRGPTGQGLAGDDVALPVEFGKGKNEVWMRPLPGKAWSSPIVYQGRIYLTNAVPVKAGPRNDQSLRALCLDAGTGKIIWDKEVFLQDGSKAPAINGKNSHASPTPLCDGKRLYVHFGHQGTACLDLEGKVVWRNRTVKYAPVHGNGGTPILVDDRLVFTCDGGDQAFLVALDKNTGEVSWKTDRNVQANKTFSFGTPLAIVVKGQKQIISPASNMVGAYDPQTGKEIWRVEYDGYSVIPRPVFGHGLVFIGTGYNSPSLLAIRPDGQGDVTRTHVAWTARRGAPHTPSPLLVGSELYLVSDRGIATCLDAKSGKVHWQKRIDGNYSASPIYAGGKVYFLSEEGTATVIQAGKEFKQLAKNVLGERSLASYAVAEGALFVRTARGLYRFQTGKAE
jgi:outer membrane protein assembly factor BamB